MGNIGDALGALIKLLVATIIFLLIALVSMTIVAFAHDGAPHRQAMGHKSTLQNGGTYLYGINRNNPQLGVINCCLERSARGEAGDCKEIPPPQPTKDGWLMPDGDVVPYDLTNVSPDDKFYACKYPNSKTHCLFAPPQGY